MNDTKNVLLATIGMSSQVVTETLYAIHRENKPWPDEIFLITTSAGKKKTLTLGFEQHLQRLCSEIQRPLPAFAESHILVTPGADGTDVEDARSLEDHEALANFIMTEVRNRTADANTSLHASLAGGRKTMTFYIGYAMSLFGRQQDTLSHVLVSDGYEGNPKFWFPTQTEKHRHFNDKEGNPLDASTAEVTLAPIPFIRHRHDLPKVLLQHNSANNETVNFADLVQLINLGENPASLRLEIDQPAKLIRLKNNHSTLVLEFQPSLLELAFYSIMARATQEEDKEFVRPAKAEEGDRDLAALLLEELMTLCGLRHKGGLKANFDELNDWNSLYQELTSRTLNAIEHGVKPNWFDSRLTGLRKMFETKLPPSLVRWLIPSVIWSGTGEKISATDIDKTPKGGGYGINLKPEQIHIIEGRAE